MRLSAAGVGPLEAWSPPVPQHVEFRREKTGRKSYKDCNAIFNVRQKGIFRRELKLSQ
jgi:hypothetical protein